MKTKKPLITITVGDIQETDETLKSRFANDMREARVIDGGFYCPVEVKSDTGESLFVATFPRLNVGGEIVIGALVLECGDTTNFKQMPEHKMKTCWKHQRSEVSKLVREKFRLFLERYELLLKSADLVLHSRGGSNSVPLVISGKRAAGREL
jgi:hypothetical protein